MPRPLTSRRRSARLMGDSAPTAESGCIPLTVGRVRKRRCSASARQQTMPRRVSHANTSGKHPGSTQELTLPSSPCSPHTDVSPMNDLAEVKLPTPEHRINAMSLSFEPDGLPLGREKEANALIHLLRESFMPDHASKSVYICGTPGTGKTFTVTKVIDSLRTSKNPQVIDLTCDSDTLPEDNMEISSTRFHCVWVNCANLQHPAQLYERIASSLNLSTSDVSARTAIHEYASCAEQPIVVVLDEVDFLTSRDQMLLYTAFEWPHLPSSQFTVVGISNSMDLPVRFLPWLRAAGCMPSVIPFKPYTSAALQSIVKQRLQAGDGSGLDHIAVSLAAKKVAAASGDARLMLDVCSETQNRLIETPDAKPIVVVASIIDRKGGLSAAVDTIKQLPRQQQIALCVAANATLTLRFEKSKSKATLGGLYDAFVALCEKVHISRLSFSDFADICSNALAHHGLLDVPTGKSRGSKYARTLRSRAVRLKVPVEDVRAGVADRGFLPFLVKK